MKNLLFLKASWYFLETIEVYSSYYRAMSRNSTYDLLNHDFEGTLDCKV